MANERRDRESGRPATLGSTLTAGLSLIVWCKACRHQVEPDVAEQVQRYGAGLTIPEWADRLRCSRCGMAAPKGTRPPGGSRKGRPNKVSGAVREMVLEALAEKGGTKWLLEQMDKNPVAYMALLGKILPHQAVGGDGGPLGTTRPQLGDKPRLLVLGERAGDLAHHLPTGVALVAAPQEDLDPAR